MRQIGRVVRSSTPRLSASSSTLEAGKLQIFLMLYVGMEMPLRLLYLSVRPWLHILHHHQPATGLVYFRIRPDKCMSARRSYSLIIRKRLSHPGVEAELPYTRPQSLLLAVSARSGCCALS